DVLSRERGLPPRRAPFTRLAAEWRHLLFPDASDERFADSYAQTVTFGMLLARSQDIPLSGSLHDAAEALSQYFGLLGRALDLLTLPAVAKEVGPSLDVLQQYVAAVDPYAFAAQQEFEFEPETEGTPNPWLYFYEDFLAEYDPVL